MTTFVLIIFEKPSQLKKFRDVLFKDSTVQTQQEATQLYTYHGKWFGQKDDYDIIMLPLAGHITNIDTPDAYGWGKIEPIELVKRSDALILIEDKTFAKAINKLAKNVEEIWIATDPDSEGDNIGWEAYQIAIKSNPNLTQHVRRIWNSSLTFSEILRAVKDAEARPYGWDTNLALSVQGRRIADAWLGFAGTRELTGSARKIIPLKVLSVGRVQLPTLKMVVDRDLEHETFIPKDLWNVNAKLEQNQKIFEARHHLSPLEDKQKADELFLKVKAAKRAVIENLDTKDVRKLPPAPLNTTEAISLLAKLHNLKAEEALEILSTLYLEGLISYPRTENTSFGDGYPHKEILKDLAQDPQLSPLIGLTITQTQVRTNGKKKGVEDHDPIHPSGELPKISQTIQPIHMKVWETIARHYIGMFMGDLVLAKTKVSLNINNELFIAEGSIVMEPGWTLAIDWSKPDDVELPSLTKGNILPIIDIILAKSQTRPKPRWKDSTVLKQMDRLGLGTKSSRPTILETLVDRKYIVRTKKHELLSTPVGRTLVTMLEPIWTDIVTNKFTKSVEEKMDLVATGKKPYPQLLAELQHYYLQAHQSLLPKLPTFQESLKQLDPNMFELKSFASKKRSYQNTSKNVHSSPNHAPLSSFSCPSCKEGKLIQRLNSKTNESFYGCSNYPSCKFTMKELPISINSSSEQVNTADETKYEINIKESTSKKRTPKKKASSNSTREKTPKKTKKKIPTGPHLIDNTDPPLSTAPAHCPSCKKGKLVQRVNSKTNESFYGCSNYPSCKYTIKKLPKTADNQLD